jgi:hypothetical protein
LTVLRATRVGDSYVVETDDDRLRDALDDLYFERDGGVHVRAFPPASVSAEVFERFVLALEPMLRQTARLEATPWDAALRSVVERLGGVEWWLAGSAALAVRGIDVAPRDIDLVVDGAGAEVALGPALIEPVTPTEGWFCRRFGRAFLGMRVEWVEDVLPSADEPEPTDFGPVAAASLENVRWQGFDLRVPPLSLQRAAAARRGLLDRVALIDAISAR